MYKRSGLRCWKNYRIQRAGLDLRGRSARLHQRRLSDLRGRSARSARLNQRRLLDLRGRSARLNQRRRSARLNQRRLSVLWIRLGLLGRSRLWSLWGRGWSIQLR